MSIIASFKKSFLSESPKNIGKGHGYMCQWLSKIIHEFLDNGYAQIAVTNNCFKMETKIEVYYWIVNEQNEIILATTLEKSPFAVIVRALGKDERYVHRAPFAYELFEIIINDTKSPLRLMSDESITIDGYKNWEKLFDLGYKIFVYNNEPNAGQSMQQIKSKEEMNSFYSTEGEYSNWQYVISESVNLDYVIGPFGLRRLRELSGQSERNS
jgi:hypothetical protein